MRMIARRIGRRDARAPLALLLVWALTACASLSRKEKGAAIGAAAGGVVGGVIGNQTGSTARGAIIDWTLYCAPWGGMEFGIQDLDDHDIAFAQPPEDETEE